MHSDDFVHEILTSIKDIINELKTDSKDIKKDIQEIKLDVAHHILRTDILQDQQKKQDEILNQLQKDNWRVKGALSFIGFVLMLLATYQIFKTH